MVYTVTFNPALDYCVRITDFKLGTINKPFYEQILPGGKGINVSTVLTNLGVENTALGFIAGFTGNEIEHLMEKAGCKTDFVRLKSGLSRINIDIESHDETQINCSGPLISEIAIELMFDKLNKLSDGDSLVLAGSIPPSISSEIYKEIMDKLKDRSINIIVDATNDLLLKVLPNKPFLIKPNNLELGEIFNKTIDTKDEIIHHAKLLQKQGARNVLVSLASEGAVLVSESDEVLICNAPKGKLINSVGAGDSMVAGFLTGWLENHDYQHALKMGVSAGSASAFSEHLAKKEEVEKLYLSLKCEKLL